MREFREAALVKEKILCVDDEASALEGYQRILHRQFEVHHRGQRARRARHPPEVGPFRRGHIGYADAGHERRGVPRPGAGEGAGNGADAADRLLRHEGGLSTR